MCVASPLASPRLQMHVAGTSEACAAFSARRRRARSEQTPALTLSLMIMLGVSIPSRKLKNGQIVVKTCSYSLIAGNCSRCREIAAAPFPPSKQASTVAIQQRIGTALPLSGFAMHIFNVRWLFMSVLLVWPAGQPRLFARAAGGVQRQAAHRVGRQQQQHAETHALQPSQDSTSCCPLWDGDSVIEGNAKVILLICIA